MASPAVNRRAGIVVSGEIVFRNPDGQPGGFVPQVLLAQGFCIIFRVAGDEELAAILGGHGVQPRPGGACQNLDFRNGLHILPPDGGMPGMGHPEFIVKAPEQNGIFVNHLMPEYAKELFRQQHLLNSIVVIQRRLGTPADMQGAVDMGLAPLHDAAQLVPIPHLLKFQLLHRCAGDDKAVEILLLNFFEAAVERTVATIQENLQRSTVLNCPIQVQSSVSVRGQAGVVDTIRLNLQSMRTKKLMDRTSVHSELLRSLLQALAQCDPDTGAHVQRTQRTGGELGRRINLSDHDQSNLALLAIMHDIGKIGIPLEILNKPGKLSDSEWAMMKTHVNKGYQIAKSSKEFNEIAEMILYHHERWDGHGYPKGLRGEEIPLLSRIIAVVDAYDAMTNDRAYRKALSESAARSELLRGAGTQFDPNIVREFLEMLEEFDRKQGVTVATMSQQESGDVRQQRDSAAAEERNVQILSYSVYLINDSMQILRVDDAFEAITGYSPSEVADGNMTQYSLIFPEDLQEYQDILHRKMDLDTDLYLRHRLRRKDGSPILVYCYGHDFYDSAVGEKRIRVVIIDSNAPLGQRTEK